MKENLYIIGAGSVGGHIALNISQYSDRYEIGGFFDDDPQKVGTEQYGFKVIDDVAGTLKFEDASVAIGIAFPKIKRKILDKLSANSSLQYPSLIHEKAWVSNNVTIGKGCIIYPGTAVNFGSEINDFVCINMNCSLGHHTQVGRYSSLAPGVSTGGHTIIREAVNMGIGSSTLQNAHIGGNSTVGGQSIIINDVEPGSTVIGVPGELLTK